MEETEKSRFYPNEFNWWELDQSCEKCKMPMHMASGQDLAFCPNCAADRENARRGRAMLALAKARDLRKRLDAMDEHRNSGEDGPQGCLQIGMPL